MLAEQQEQPLKIFSEYLEEIANDTGLPAADILSPTQSAPIVRARWRLFAQLRARGWTLVRIASMFTRSDGSPMVHGTILHGIRRHKQLLSENNLTNSNNK